jgi:hypothetical protein
MWTTNFSDSCSVEAFKTVVDDGEQSLTRFVDARRIVLCESWPVSSGAHPTVASYNGSVAKIYNSTNSIVRFRIKIIFPTLKNALAYVPQHWRCC